MVDQTNIFGENGSTPDTPGDAEQSSVFQVPESANEFIGEGKKYTDVNKALESIPHAQSHIQKLEQELTETRAKLEATSSIEETLAQFANQKEQETPTSQPIDMSEVANLVDQRLQARSQEEVQKSNVGEVIDSLTKQFGDKEKAEAAYVAKAAELGVDTSYMNNLAATSPKAVYALFGTSVRPTSQEFNRSSVNTEAFGSTSNDQKPIKSVMSGASTSEVMDAWRAATSNLGV
jgi:hypothetical protein